MSLAIRLLEKKPDFLNRKPCISTRPYLRCNNSTIEIRPECQPSTLADIDTVVVRRCARGSRRTTCRTENRPAIPRPQQSTTSAGGVCGGPTLNPSVGAWRLHPADAAAAVATFGHRRREEIVHLHYYSCPWVVRSCPPRSCYGCQCDKCSHGQLGSAERVDRQSQYRSLCARLPADSTMSVKR